MLMISIRHNYYLVGENVCYLRRSSASATSFKWSWKFLGFQLWYHIHCLPMKCHVHPAMLFWQRSVCWQRSSDVIPPPCEHTSSDEDCSSRITNSYYPQYSNVFRIACHGSVASNEGVRYFFNLLKLPLTSESFGALYLTNKVQSRA